MAVEQTHNISYGGSWNRGYWWKCSCGAGMGLAKAWDDDPFEQALDRTWWAHKHLREVSE